MVYSALGYTAILLWVDICTFVVARAQEACMCRLPNVRSFATVLKTKFKWPRSEAPSTRIRIFLNPQLFLSGFKNFPVLTQRIQIEFTRPHVSDGIRIHSSTQGSSALKWLQSMRRRARQWREICSVHPTRAFKLTALLVYQEVLATMTKTAGRTPCEKRIFILPLNVATL